jgi:hypothetical protein
MKKERSHTNKLESLAQKVYTKGEGYEMYYSFRNYPVSQAFYEKLGLELMKWADTQQKQVSLSKFCRERRIPWITFLSWRKKSEKLEEAAQEAKRAIGDNREDLLMAHKYPERSFLWHQGHFHKEWREEEEHRINLKAKAQAVSGGQPTTIKVVMPEIPRVEEKK